MVKLTQKRAYELLEELILTKATQDYLLKDGIYFSPWMAKISTETDNNNDIKMQVKGAWAVKDNDVYETYDFTIYAYIGTGYMTAYIDKESIKASAIKTHLWD